MSVLGDDTDAVGDEIEEYDLMHGTDEEFDQGKVTIGIVVLGKKKEIWYDEKITQENSIWTELIKVNHIKPDKIPKLLIWNMYFVVKHKQYFQIGFLYPSK